MSGWKDWCTAFRNCRVDPAPWYRRPAPLAIIVAAILVVLNLAFR